MEGGGRGEGCRSAREAKRCVREFLSQPNGQWTKAFRRKGLGLRGRVEKVKKRDRSGTPINNQMKNTTPIHPSEFSTFSYIPKYIKPLQKSPLPPLHKPSLTPLDHCLKEVRDFHNTRR